MHATCMHGMLYKGQLKIIYVILCTCTPDLKEKADSADSLILKRTVQNLDSALWTEPWTGLWTQSETQDLD